jgi:CheY-like chemotaxis protein
VPEARILLVEDEFLVRLILAEALADSGFAVTEAEGGAEAVHLLDGPARFDLLITDVQMPGPPDGIGVAQHARARHPDMPIVFATARPDSIRAFRDRHELDAIVPKPYGPEQMLAAVRRILGAGSGAP